MNSHSQLILSIQRSDGDTELITLKYKLLNVICGV